MNVSHNEPVQTVDFTVGPAEAGLRLDNLLVSRIPGCSRTQVGRSVRTGLFKVNDIVRKPGYRVAIGDHVTGDPLSLLAQPPCFRPEQIDLEVIHADPALIVINKPPGLVVHPAPGHSGGTLAHGLLHRFPELETVGSCPERPGIVHRLDKDTSGLLIVARTLGAYHHLLSQFKSRTMEKRYLALVYGDPKENSGRITLPIARHPVHRKKMAAADDQRGRPAETNWLVRQRFRGVSLLEFEIKTGRTHQIRVHSAAMGHPVVGDATYGFRNPLRTFCLGKEVSGLIQQHVKRQLLHAAEIRLTHPASELRVEFHAPLPIDMATFLSILEGLGSD